MPPDLTPPALDADSGLVEVVTAALCLSVGQIIANDHVIRLDDDIEGVHKARVGTRRLRSDLQTLGPVLAEGWADDVRAELKDLAGALGRVRDTDVLVERLWRTAEALPADDRRRGGAGRAPAGGRARCPARRRCSPPWPRRATSSSSTVSWPRPRDPG